MDKLRNVKATEREKMRGMGKIPEEQLAVLYSIASATLSLRYEAETTHNFSPKLQ